MLSREWNERQDSRLDGKDAESGFGKLGAGHFRTLLMPDMKTLEMVYDKLESFMMRRVR